MNRAHLMLAALLLAGCSAASEGSPKDAGSPAGTAAPSAPAPEAAGTPAAAASPVRGAEAPAFALAPVHGGLEVSLSESVKAAAGKPTILVLGAAACSFSRQQVEDLAAAKPDHRVLAVVSGSAAEVKESLPAAVPFPVLVDDGGAVLRKYRVVATPSVVLLDGKGSIAYIGGGGYIDPKVVLDLAGRVARGESVDPAGVKVGGG
jgi:hypothetical protein